MNIHQLRCAVTVARLGSQTRAAEALYMSQPNLSKAIKDLEQVCGFRIFNRTGSGMLPTRKGEEFLLRARSVLEQMDAMDRIYQGHNRSSAYLSVAGPRAGYLSHAISEFVNALDPRSGMELNIRQTDAAGTVRDVLSREADIGIIRYSLDNANKVLNGLAEQGLHYILYYTFRHAAVLSRRHPLARAERLTRAELLPYIELSQGDTPRPVPPEDAAPENGMEARHIRLYDWGGLVELLESSPLAYLWDSPMPAKLLDRHGLVQKECEDAGPEYQDALIYLKGYSMSRWEQAFYDLIRKEIDKL